MKETVNVPKTKSSESSNEARPVNIEATVCEGFENGEVISEELLDARLAGMGFAHQKAGTYKAELNGAPVYLYQKRPACFADLAQTREFVATAEKFTENGLLFPGTRWGICKKSENLYQVFAVTRGLLPVSQGPQDKWDKIRKFPGNELYRRSGVSEGSVSAELENMESPVHFIDTGEAGHVGNWGWSEEYQSFYPIDVEVIMLGGTAEMRKSNQQAFALQAPSESPVAEI